MKTLEELRAEEKSLENRKFYLEMKDRWSTSDFELNRKLWNQIVEIQKQIKELEEVA